MSKTNNTMTLQTGGVFNSAERLGLAIKTLGEKFNLIVPGGAIGSDLPLLHAAGISFVFVAPDETYKLPGRSQVGIGKNALDRISASAGIHWNPSLCGKVDNGEDQNLVEFQAVGTVLQLDGTERMITAVKRIDLRADKDLPVEKWGSDAQEIHRNAAKDNRDCWPQIIQARQNILSLAESKAKNRAIRSLGVRTAYEPADLAKGFAILRLQFTGRSEDPEIEREVSMMIARRALGAASILYGPPRSEFALPPARMIAKVARVVSVEPEESDKDEDQPDPGAQETQTETKSDIQAPNPPTEDPSVISGAKDKEGNWPKKPCSQLSVDDLKRKISAYEKKRPEWDPKWAAKNEAELNAMKMWLAFKEMDPRQGQLNMDKTAAQPTKEPDKVPY